MPHRRPGARVVSRPFGKTPAPNAAFEPLRPDLYRYFFTPDVIAEVCSELGVPYRVNGYRDWPPA